MRALKPSILSQLVESSDRDPATKRNPFNHTVLVSRMFEFATFKPIKSTQIDPIDSIEKNMFKESLEKLIQFK